jgi:AraC-like DNA-binding protein/Ser/Thr protein kinase RdoA (MazF antagonist)
MDITTINNSLDYIEKHLQLKLTSEMVASSVKYSHYHFTREFSDVIGITVKRYINKRKVMAVLYKTQLGATLLTAAFDYGYDDYSGFYKACKRIYGMSPKVCLEEMVLTKPKVFFIGKERYPMLTEQKLKQVIKKWSLKSYDIKPVYSENRQQRKDQFLVDDYRIIVTNNYNKIIESKRITDALIADGIKTPNFIKNKEGEYYIQLEDQYIVIKEDFKYKSYSFEEIESSKEIRTRLGESVAKLHLTLQSLDQNIEPVNSFMSCKNWAIKEVEKLETTDKLPQAFYEDYLNFEELSKSIPYSIIHRDMNLTNIYFNEDKLLGYGDFQLTKKDMRLFDICYLSTSILAEPGMDQSKWLEIFSDLIEGYNGIIKLTDDEKKALPYVVFSIQLIVIAYFATQASHQDLALKNYKLLKWLYENLA